MTVLEIDVELVDPAEVEIETPDVELTPSGGETVLLVATPGPPGERGPIGPAGDGAQVFNETPTGAKNGTNKIFTLANTYAAGSTLVYINGLRERLNIDYTESGAAQITLDEAPTSTDQITVDYLIA